MNRQLNNDALKISGTVDKLILEISKLEYTVKELENKNRLLEDEIEELKPKPQDK